MTSDEDADGVRGQGSGIRGLGGSRVRGGGWARAGGHRRRGRSTEMDKELVLEPFGHLCLCPLWSLRWWGAAQSLCCSRAPSVSCHFHFFFSFANLVSSAPCSLLNFIIFLPSGVLKYQS